MARKTKIDTDLDTDLLDVIDESDIDSDDEDGDVNPSNWYVDPERLQPELLEYSIKFKEWRDNDKVGERPRLPEYVAYAILEISNRTSMLRNYIGYPDRDGMVGAAIENMVKYVHNYNPEKGDGFSYITQCVKTAFWRYINAEKVHLYVKAKKIQMAGIEDEIYSLQDHEEDVEFRDTFIELLQDSTDIIDNFETRMKTKKEKSRKKSIKEDAEKKGLAKFAKKMKSE
jgi:hypothetical protein